MIIYAEGAVNNGRTMGNNGALLFLDHRGRRIGFCSKGSEGGGLGGLQPVADGAACTWLLGYLFFVAIFCPFAERIQPVPRDV